MFDRKIKLEVKNEIYKAKKELKQELKQELKDAVEEICIQAIKEMFSVKSNEKTIGRFPYSYEIMTIGGEFKSRAMQSLGEGLSKKCTKAANDIVLGEEFIDSVVERIKKKQIGE